MKLFFLFFSTFIFGFFFTKSLISFALKRNLYKSITDRDIHLDNIPNIGGVSIFITFLFGFIMLLFFDFDLFFENIYLNFLVVFSAFLFFLIGLFDDIFHVSFLTKFIFQFLFAFIFVFLFDVRIESFYGLFGLYDFSILTLNFFSCLVFVFVINSINLIDGVDGLASFIGIYINFVLSLIFFYNHLYFEFYLSIILSISLFSFVFYNKPIASIFMGDSGSLFIGFLISYLSIKACNLPINNLGEINPVFILCILSYPAVDTLRVFCIRIFNGLSPFMPDKNHIHHYLINMNCNHLMISVFAVFYSFILTLFAYLSSSHITLSFVFLVFLSLLIIKMLKYFL